MPYTCFGCNKIYQNCPFTKCKYNAAFAQKKVDCNLVNSRRGLDIDWDEFKKIDSLIKDGLIIINPFIKLRLKIITVLNNLLLLYIFI